MDQYVIVTSQNKNNDVEHKWQQTLEAYPRNNKGSAKSQTLIRIMSDNVGSIWDIT